MQKFTFKLNPDKAFFGVMKPKRLSDGTRHLLCNGFWGISRHVNYLGEMLMATGLTLVLGWPFEFVPWLYPMYYIALLVPRQIQTIYAVPKGMVSCGSAIKHRFRGVSCRRFTKAQEPASYCFKLTEASKPRFGCSLASPNCNCSGFPARNEVPINRSQIASAEPRFDVRDLDCGAIDVALD